MTLKTWFDNPIHVGWFSILNIDFFWDVHYYTGRTPARYFSINFTLLNFNVEVRFGDT